MLKFLKKEANMTYTENGAATYRSTQSECLDLFATIGALRRESDEEITNRFLRAYAEDADLAMDWLAANSKEYSLNRKRMAVMGGSAGAITALYCAFVYPPSKARIKAVINCWGAIHDVNAIKNRRVPVLTFHGDKDALVHVCYGKAISQRMEELGSKDSKFVFMEGKGHAQYKYVGESLIGEVTDFLDKVL